MKHSVLALAIILGGLSASVSNADIIRQCEDSLKGARENYSKAQDLFNMGEVTRTDVSAAQLELLNIRLQCGNIEKDQYCGQALVAAETRLKGTILESRFGMRDATDIESAKKALQLVDDQCK